MPVQFVMMKVIIVGIILSLWTCSYECKLLLFFILPYYMKVLVSD